MKKSLWALFVFGALALTLSACQKSSDGGGGSNASTPVQDCNVPGNTNCNPGVYNQLSPQLQNYQGSYANGFCGCQYGYRAVMNAQWGVSCAPSNWFPNSAYYGFNYQQVAYPAQNTQWMAIPQVTYAPGISGTNNCQTTAASVCDIRTPNTCSNGGVCRPASGGSYMGFCTYGSGNESYSTQVCGWEWDYYQGNVYRCRNNLYGPGNSQR